MTTMQAETKSKRTAGDAKPIILITGAAGDIGSALIAKLKSDYRIVGLDREGKKAPCDLFAFDITSQDSVDLALQRVKDKYGPRLASVIHLAAYFDFSGEDNSLYQKVNVDGTRYLLRALRKLKVEQFVYSSTMLVRRPSEPGVPINEQTPIDPSWTYPESKSAAEDVIRSEHGDIPIVLLQLAGVYDERKAVPTLAAQVQRIYERDPESHVYPASEKAAQAYLHKEDMIEAFKRTVDRRKDLPPEVTVLIGEPDAMSYGELQDELGQLIHGVKRWRTWKVPKLVAKLGAWLQLKSEPIIPDDFDQGEKPFIRPFMIDRAGDSYELDISRARDLLGWSPRHSLRKELPNIVRILKDHPARWYDVNNLTKPYWLAAAEESSDDAEKLRRRSESAYRKAHREALWAPLFNMALGAWLIASPPTLGYGGAMGWSDSLSGLAVLLLAFVSLDWRYGLVRWALAAVACWIMLAPLVFWTPNPAAYLNGTLAGALIFGFSVLIRPAPGVSRIASGAGPDIPPGWDYSPSSWLQRLPIIALAVVGLLISRQMAAYQLGHIPGVWDPVFPGAAADPRNGTEEIITSSVSKAWPIPDAGIGALTYMLEILTGVIGSSRRWRTMPWLVVLFGLMIIPLGVVSITFIIIQPIMLGTWCTLCLIAAAAMLIQIPYSVDELVATGQFLARRKKRGRPLLRVFFAGDTDEGEDKPKTDEFAQPLPAIVRDMAGGGVGLPWSLAVSIALGVWLMLTRLTLGSSDMLANTEHLIGALVITASVAALAETARPVRFLNAALGLALAIAPFMVGAGLLQTAADVVCGLALIALSIPRGKIHHRYGGWSQGLI